MNTIAVIDADLIGRKKHRFPNLAIMKIAAYNKSIGKDVILKTDYENLGGFDKVFISKVFTDTKIPDGIISLPNVEHGGTGFYFDKAPPLPPEIEHIMPDYHIYDDWLADKLPTAGKYEFKEYTDYSIGFLTRGCFRGCEFCVNQNYKKVIPHSPLSEFYDPTRKKICLLDDNFLGYAGWRPLLEKLIATGKRFKFKQGLDERTLTDEKCKLLFSSKYDGDFTFAFDNIADRELIEAKINLIRKYTPKDMIFYELVGFDRNGAYDEAFWRQDILDMFTRMEILGNHGCMPYIMRFDKYKESPFYGIYVSTAGFCNRFANFKKQTLRDYCIAAQKNGRMAPTRYFEEGMKEIPELKNYYDKLFYIK